MRSRLMLLSGVLLIMGVFCIFKDAEASDYAQWARFDYSQPAAVLKMGVGDINGDGIKETVAISMEGQGVEFEIEFDVPPPTTRAGHSPYFEPVKRLTRKGAFFFVPERKRSRSVSAMIRDISYRLKIKLTIRREFVHPKTGKVGVGVWRIE